MTKTGTRVRTEGDGVENNAKPYGLKSEQIHDDESGHKPVIIEVENAQSQLRSATMEKPEDQQSGQQAAKTGRKTRTLGPRSSSQQTLNATTNPGHNRLGDPRHAFVNMVGPNSGKAARAVKFLSIAAICCCCCPTVGTNYDNYHQARPNKNGMCKFPQFFDERGCEPRSPNRAGF